MLLYKEPFFKFSFNEPRKIQRIHLEEVQTGSFIILYGNAAGEGDPLANGFSDEHGWVTLDREIWCKAGDCFFAIPQQSHSKSLPPK